MGPHRFDPVQVAHYFNYETKPCGVEGAIARIHQVWYDTADDLKAKIVAAKNRNIGGVGSWEAHELNYSLPEQFQAYWDAFKVFTHDI